jgi:hypothetical protein
MTDLIRLAEKVCNNFFYELFITPYGSTSDIYKPNDNPKNLATTVLPILKALEEEAKKPCIRRKLVEDHLLTCFQRGEHTYACRPCWSRHLIGGE